MMTSEQQAILSRLLDLVDRLYQESDSFLEETANQQLWYNRGYANGIIQQLISLGYQDVIEGQLSPDPEGVLQGHEWMPWGKAYRHGIEVGSKETMQVISSREQKF
jgi:hypothetical protein